MHEVDLRISVADACALGGVAEIAATAALPEASELADPVVVCFAFPGGGYSRHYFSFDMPDSAGGGQAGWHVDRGWIFVSVDHLGVGDSTTPEGAVLDYETVALANKVAVDHVIAQLESGTLIPGYPPVVDPVKLGIGQSMGGCFTIVLQGQHRTFDGIGTLGFSGFHTQVPSRPGTPPAVWPWIRRGQELNSAVPLNVDALTAAVGPTIDSLETSQRLAAEAGENPMAWAFHFDDEPPEIVAADMDASSGIGGPIPRWRSATMPACGAYMVAPGTVATEAAAITVPLLIAVGERDVVSNPWLEPLAFKSSTDITLFVCPRMAHMHNFATTRFQLWQRIHSWGTGVAAARAARRSRAGRSPP